MVGGGDGANDPVACQFHQLLIMSETENSKFLSTHH